MIKSRLFLLYTVVLSVCFFAGRIYIIEANNMEQGPVPMEAFQQLLAWVNAFSYFYLLPLMVSGFVAVLSFAKKKGFSTVAKIIAVSLYGLLAALAGYVLKFAFILVFYGFGP